MTTDCLVSNNMVVIDDDKPRPRPINVDVSLAVEKEMTIALTGKSKPARTNNKIIQRVSDHLTLIATRDNDKFKNLVHHKCDECQKVFITSSQFKQHSYEVHKITNPFKCTVCEKSFTTDASMKTHLKTHKDEKPYVCKECGKRSILLDFARWCISF